jgi:hypothetical protein
MFIAPVSEREFQMTHVTFPVPAKVQFLCKPTTTLRGIPQSGIRRVGSLPEHISLFDRAIYGLNLDGGEFHLSVAKDVLNNIFATLSSINDAGLATRACTVQIDSNPKRPLIRSL